MNEVMSFLRMGGYAAFVWPALGLTVVVMVGLLVQTLRQLHSRQRRLAELEAAGAQRRRRARPAAAAGGTKADNPPAEAREARP